MTLERVADHCLFVNPQMLNSLYEEMYPGLRYTTFVNGRSRAAIASELEVRLLPAFPHAFPYTTKSIDVRDYIS